MAKGDDIEERLINFAVTTIALCDKLPVTPGGRHVGGSFFVAARRLHQTIARLVVPKASVILCINCGLPLKK